MQRKRKAAFFADGFIMESDRLYKFALLLLFLLRYYCCVVVVVVVAVDVGVVVAAVVCRIFYDSTRLVSSFLSKCEQNILLKIDLKNKLCNTT